MKNYKGTDRFLCCQGFQFEIGNTYIEEKELSLCDVGFHSCDTLSQVIEYYSPMDSRYFEVEVSGEIKDMNKNCSRTIMFIRELTFNEVMRMLNYKEDGSSLSISDNQTNMGFGNHGNYNNGNYNHGNDNNGNDNDGNCNHGNHNINK